MEKRSKKRGVAVVGSWLPLSLDFLRSRACAELSPMGAKLLLDMLSTLGANASKNGDISIAPKQMAVRGWTSRSSLGAAVSELLDHGLIVKTRQGNRLDCNLFAITLYPLDCDLSKLDVTPSCYRTTDYMGKDIQLAAKPTEEKPAKWRHPRERKLKRVAPPRDKAHTNCPVTVQN